MRAWAVIGLFAVSAGLFLIQACSKRGPSAPPAVFEVADLAAAGDPGAVERSWFGATPGTLHVSNVTRFEVESASMQPTSRGSLGLAFTLIDADRGPFSTWTGARTGRVVAVLLDGRIAMCTKLGGPLPGAGVVDFGQAQPSAHELRALIERMEPR